MNTPAHAAINLMLLSRNPGHRNSAAIIGGAVIPDLAIMVFYAWQLLLGKSEAIIWSTEYHRPLWQAWIDVFNSIPLIGLAILICWLSRHYLLLLLFASMLLHAIGDLLLHHDDAHRHFFPLLEWRFESPISYWDPAHNGQWVSLIEFIGVLAATTFMYLRRPRLRAWAIAILTVYLLYWVYAYLVWI